MDNVVDIHSKDKVLIHTSYTDNDGDIGIGTLDKSIGVDRLNDNQFVVITPDGSQLHSRESLAEFAWLLAFFLDEEEKYRPNGELVCCDY